MKRRSSLALTGSFLAAPRLAAAQTLTPLTIAGVAEESVMPALWAAQAGIFHRAGLDVTVVRQGSGSAIAAGVAGGTYAAGKANMVSLINARSHNLPIAMVAGGGLYDAKSPNTALCVRADSPIKTAADLNGKSMGVSALNGIYTLSTRAWMDAHGGDSTTIKELEFPISVITEALIAGRIDAASITDPELVDALANGKVRVLTYNYSAIAPRFMYSGWFCALDFIEKNRATVSALARSMRDASAYLNAHPTAALSLLAKFGGTDPARIARMHHSTYATSLDPKLIQPVVDVCARYKTIPADFDARTMFAKGIG